MTDAIDWGLAVSTATRLAPNGPQIPREDAREAVAMLRDLAQRAVDPVREVTGLVAPVDDNAQVVDRQAWIASNASSLRLVMGPLLEKAEERLPLLVDQGEQDSFLAEQLKPQALQRVAEAVGHPLELRLQPGYDHSYFFVASFIDDHLRHHAAALSTP